MGSDGARIAQTIAARNARTRNGVADRVEGNFLAPEFAPDGRVVGARGIDADEDGSRGIARLHEGFGRLASHLDNQGLGEPDRETVEARESRIVGRRVAEGEGRLGSDYFAQDRIGKPCRRRRNETHELDTLVNSRIGVLIEKDDFVGADAQSVPHVVADVARAAQAAIDDFVERADRGGHAQAEDARKGPVVMQERAFRKLGVEHVGRVGLALARLAIYLHGKLPCA